MSELTEKQVKKIVERTVDDTLAKLGLDSEQIHEAQKDFMYLREQRKLHETMSLRIRFIIVGFIVTGALTLLFLGVKAAIGMK
mgnify:FL=1